MQHIVGQELICREANIIKKHGYIRISQSRLVALLNTGGALKEVCKVQNSAEI